MPDDEPFEYLATQAVADFLATESSVPIDGIIFPSVQAAGDVLNVVLFHKAARVEAMDIPQGTEISARTGHWGEEGWEEDYGVIEEVPPSPKEADKKTNERLGWPAGLCGHCGGDAPGPSRFRLAGCQSSHHAGQHHGASREARSIRDGRI
jgi:hypothetical protein